MGDPLFHLRRLCHAGVAILIALSGVAMANAATGSAVERGRYLAIAGNCVACHTAGTSFAKESNLVLTKKEAYAALIGVTPNNSAAAEDGLKLLETETSFAEWFQSDN